MNSFPWYRRHRPQLRSLLAASPPFSPSSVDALWETLETSPVLIPWECNDRYMVDIWSICCKTCVEKTPGLLLQVWKLTKRLMVWTGLFVFSFADRGVTRRNNLNGPRSSCDYWGGDHGVVLLWPNLICFGVFFPVTETRRLCWAFAPHLQVLDWSATVAEASKMGRGCSIWSWSRRNHSERLKRRRKGGLCGLFSAALASFLMFPWFVAYENWRCCCMAMHGETLEIDAVSISKSGSFLRGGQWVPEPVHECRNPSHPKPVKSRVISSQLGCKLKHAISCNGLSKLSNVLACGKFNDQTVAWWCGLS